MHDEMVKTSVQVTDNGAIIATANPTDNYVTTADNHSIYVNTGTTTTSTPIFDVRDISDRFNAGVRHPHSVTNITQRSDRMNLALELDDPRMTELIFEILRKTIVNLGQITDEVIDCTLEFGSETTVIHMVDTGTGYYKITMATEIRNIYTMDIYSYNKYPEINMTKSKATVDLILELLSIKLTAIQHDFKVTGELDLDRMQFIATATDYCIKYTNDYDAYYLMLSKSPSLFAYITHMDGKVICYTSTSMDYIPSRKEMNDVLDILVDLEVSTDE